MKFLRVVLCCAVVAALPAHAQKSCSKADAANAEKAIDRVNDWAGLHRAYQTYGHCDTDAVNDVFTDALLRLMVEWKNLDGVASAVASDAGYKKWMHARLLSPAAKDDRDSVYSRAKKDCPGKHSAFCAELAEVVKPAGGKPGASTAGGLEFETLQPIPTAPPKK